MDWSVHNNSATTTRKRSRIRPTARAMLEHYQQLGDPEPRRHLRYADLIVPDLAAAKGPLMRTAYQEATVVKQASWFEPKLNCSETCCAEGFAVSIGKEHEREINAVDGQDLADLFLFGHRLQPYHSFAAKELTMDVVPCLRPGVIIHADSYRGPITRWFEEFRPNLKVPYVFITSKTDGSTPIEFYEHKLDEDELLLKWYGINPSYLSGANHSKYQAMPLGLAGGKFRQQPYFDIIMQERRYANPFGGDLSRWTNNKALQTASDTTEVLFVNFKVHENARHRKRPFDMACGNRTTPPLDDISCNKGDTVPRISELLNASSKYLFGLSPPGNGLDCFRNYEFLFNGLIPVVLDHPGYELIFQDLPILRLNGWNLTQRQLLQKMRDYVQSPEFIKNNFDKGWERMFLSYWRNKVLKDAGRLHEIVHDDDGNPYYTMWSYTSYRPPLIKHAVSEELRKKKPPTTKSHKIV